MDNAEPDIFEENCENLWYTLIAHSSPFSNDILPSKRSVCGNIAKGCEQENSEGRSEGW